MRFLDTPALRFRNFRCLWLAVFFNSVGMVGEQVVLGWLALELTDSPFAVGVALGLRMVPLFLLGIPAGVMADQVDRSRLIHWTSAAMAGQCAILGVLVLLRVVAFWHLLLLAFTTGCLQALYQTARQSYAHDIVGASHLVNALAFLGLAMRLGGLLGSLVAGTLIARLGSEVAYFALAVAYGLVGLALAGVVPEPRDVPAPRSSLWQGLFDYLAVARQNRVLPLLLVFTAAAEIFGFAHQALLPSLARDVLAVGPEGLGAMTAARSIGGILGIVAVSGRGQTPGNGAIFLSVLFVFGAALVALGFAGSLPWVLATLVLANAMGAVSDVLSQSLIQLSVPGKLHGRAGGTWVLAIGTAPLGQLQIGALASLFGVTVALAASGLGLIVVAAAGALFVPRLRRL